MTTRDERLLLTELQRVCHDASAFSLIFPEGMMPLDEEFAFGFWLLDIGYGILMHARERQREEGRS